MVKQVVKEKIRFEEFILITKNDIERKIQEIVLNQQIKNLLAGGKRLRPIFATLAFKSCTCGKETNKVYEKSLEGCICMELGHAASLIHDDIIDKDLHRRGKPAFYISHGISKALLIGHKMLALGFDLSLKQDTEFAQLYVQTWKDSLNGEIYEVDFNVKKYKIKSSKILLKSDVFKNYYKIIELKTAILFSSACKAGAIQANTKEEIVNVLSEYGKEVGFAYQLADDLIDLENGEMIDSVFVPLLTWLENKKIDINSSQIDKIKEKICKNKDRIKKIFIEEIQEHLKKAEELGKSKIIPESPYKDLFQEVPRYIINSILKEINLSL